MTTSSHQNNKIYNNNHVIPQLTLNFVFNCLYVLCRPWHLSNNVSRCLAAFKRSCSQEVNCSRLIISAARATGDTSTGRSRLALPPDAFPLLLVVPSNVDHAVGILGRGVDIGVGATSEVPLFSPLFRSFFCAC